MIAMTILTVEEIRAVLARKGDIHTASAAKAFSVPEDRVTPQQRQWAKIENYRAMYDPAFWREVNGMGSPKA